MKRIKIALSKVRWGSDSLPSLPKNFDVYIPSDTPDWAIMQAIQEKCIQKFGEYPWAYSVEIPGRS